jgi:hypothetical protein
LWVARIKKENKIEMFELTRSFRLDKNLADLIQQSLSLLSKNTEKYFPSLDVSSLDCLRDLFVLNAFESAELTLADDALMEIRNDRRLKLKYSSTDMTPFWLSLQQEYPIITQKVTEALLPFFTLYLCEAGFSAMNMMKKNLCCIYC